MSGIGRYDPEAPDRQPDVARLRVPGLAYAWGSRGLVLWGTEASGTTVFPVAALRASTFDLELERRIGKAIAREARLAGRHVLVAPVLDPVLHPRWGRAQEAYGEDPFLVGAMGAAFVRGAQHDPSTPDPADPDQPLEDTYRVMACAGELGQLGAEDVKRLGDARVDPRTQREVLLPPLRRALEEGLAMVQTAPSRVNGSPAGQSAPLLRELLRSELGFDGATVSAWYADLQTGAALEAGLDVHMPFSGFCVDFSCWPYGAALVRAVEGGEADEGLVDAAALRVLRRKAAFGVLDHPASAHPDLLLGAEARALALRAAEEGIVLLENGPTARLEDDVLPLSRDRVRRIAVVGRYADAENTGDRGYSGASTRDAALVATPYEGLAAALGATNPSRTTCGDAARCALTFTSVAGNEAALAGLDALFVVAAPWPADLARTPSGEEGWWTDRASLGLPARDLENVAAAAALRRADPRLAVVVILKGGGAVVTAPWAGGVDAVLHAGFGGMAEGIALGEIAFGDVNPSGRLVQSFPEAESDLPPLAWDAAWRVEVAGLHGYRWLDRAGIPPRYAFGHGLSYTTFAYAGLALSAASIDADGVLTLTVDVTNTGPVAGSDVVQAYVSHPGTAVTAAPGRPAQELKAFARVADLAPGETRTVTLALRAADLAYYDLEARAMRVERVTYGLRVGPSARLGDPRSLEATFAVR